MIRSEGNDTDIMIWHKASTDLVTIGQKEDYLLPDHRWLQVMKPEESKSWVRGSTIHTHAQVHTLTPYMLSLRERNMGFGTRHLRSNSFSVTEVHYQVQVHLCLTASSLQWNMFLFFFVLQLLLRIIIPKPQGIQVSRYPRFFPLFKMPP